MDKDKRQATGDKLSAFPRPAFVSFASFVAKKLFSAPLREANAKTGAHCAFRPLGYNPRFYGIPGWRPGARRPVLEERR